MKKKTTTRRTKRHVVPSHCFFCKEKKMPWFSDTQDLMKFTTERGKIIARSRSGLCAKHQRRLTAAIKNARHVALLPFVAQD